MELVANAAGPEFDWDACLEQIAEVIATLFEVARRIVPVIIEGVTWLVDGVVRPVLDRSVFDSSLALANRCPMGFISKFDALAGKMMWEAQQKWGKRIPKDERALIAEAIDQAKFRPVNFLEGEDRKRLATWNRHRHGEEAIHTFTDALKSKDFKRGALRRLYRANDKWKAAIGFCPAEK